ncbi:twin-arginine translocase TatA/TatE family subunit [Desulfotruncus alcoholivorax]|uniref:twin-arginine translocase TatA/TatE family subunit n=1 Tax=Desulfotruncus alcoholivorax TaxID=265477 RepID=UPI00040A90D3|nr:twin-arginine translocase TatA/TatE family subunit [Desulfotruncus alcoholivorax]
MFNGLFQPTHLILILVVVLIIFGPGKLPEVGKALGNAARDMKNAFAGEEGDDKAQQKSDSIDGVAAASAAAGTSNVSANASKEVN